MMKRMLSWSVFTCLLLTACTDTVGPTCRKAEELILQFETVKGKTGCVCLEESNKYLVYRFGEGEKVQFEYPKYLDAEAWKLFRFSGIGDSENPEEADFGSFRLTMPYGKDTLEIREDWYRPSPQSDTLQKSLAIRIFQDNQNHGMPAQWSSKQGSLFRLMNHPLLGNSWKRE